MTIRNTLSVALTIPIKTQLDKLKKAKMIKTGRRNISYSEILYDVLIKR